MSEAQFAESGERLEFRGTFYTHTLMTPFFSPGANPHGRPPVALAGFGPAMIAVAGEVADGWIVHPLNSPAYVEAVGLPALSRGLARAGRERRDIEIACQTIAMIGSTDTEIATARMKAKGQIADSERKACSKALDGDTQRGLRVNTRLSACTWKHMLLPLYVAAYMYGAKTYRFVVNGQTGEVQGEAPISWVKVGAIVGVIVAVIAATKLLNLW